MSHQNGYIARLNSALKKVESDERYLGFDRYRSNQYIWMNSSSQALLYRQESNLVVGVCHTIKLDSPINVYGSVRDRCIVQHEDVTQLKELNNA